MNQKIVPNLWFSRNAKEAVDYYVSVFPNSKIVNNSYYPESEAEGLAEFQKEFAGKVLTVDYELDGQEFTAINADDTFKINEAVSFVVKCKDQEEIDYYWEKLSSDPKFEQCGWCKDKFGVSWQIVPENVDELIGKPGNFAIMMQQKKIIIDEYK